MLNVIKNSIVKSSKRCKISAVIYLGNLGNDKTLRKFSSDKRKRRTSTIKLIKIGKLHGYIWP